MKDLLGKALAVDDFVLTNQNNRIVVAKVVKFSDTFVFVKPIESDAGKVGTKYSRRAVPPQKVLRKAEYNVARIDPSEITWAGIADCI